MLRLSDAEDHICRNDCWKVSPGSEMTWCPVLKGPAEGIDLLGHNSGFLARGLDLSSKIAGPGSWAPGFCFLLSIASRLSAGSLRFRDGLVAESLTKSSTARCLSRSRW